MPDRETRIEILGMVQRGEITPQEGLRLIRAVVGSLDDLSQPARLIETGPEAYRMPAIPDLAEADGREFIPVVASTPATALDEPPTVAETTLAPEGAAEGGEFKNQEAATIPAVIMPAAIMPAATMPAATTPATTMPATTMPAATMPAITTPAISMPETVPAASIPKAEPNLSAAGEMPVPEPPGQPEPPVSLTAAGAVKPDSAHEDEIQGRIRRLKQWGLIPFWIGMILTILSAFWMFLGYQAAGLGWGFWLSWFPFTLGVLLMMGGWWSQTARWLHVRVRQKSGQKPGLIAISFPLPLKLAVWAMHTFRRTIPKWQGENIDEFIRMADENISVDSPFYVEVNDDDEQVEVFIG